MECKGNLGQFRQVSDKRQIDKIKMISEASDPVGKVAL